MSEPAQGRHHIWCNRDPRAPRESCDMCKPLDKLYPEDGLTPEELVAKYFPDVIIREGT